MTGGVVSCREVGGWSRSRGGGGGAGGELGVQGVGLLEREEVYVGREHGHGVGLERREQRQV